MYQPEDKIGPYTLVKRLGQGSFGVVWLARDSSSIVRDLVALKLPLGDEIDSEKMRQEAVLWLRASGHPNIVPVIDARLYQDQITIVTEYVAGGTLEERLDRTGGKAQSVEWAVAITAGILKGLEHLHSLNMVHRDLKPSNVMLDGETPRLTDFGLVRILRSSARNRPSDGAGTFPYTAPEMFRGAFSEQSDVWSAGVILYQMLAGILPFPQEHHAEIMYAICNSDAPALPDSIPERVRRIVAQALDRDLTRRYPTARAMREALSPHPGSDLLHKSMSNVPSAESAMFITKAVSTNPAAISSLYDLPPVALKQDKEPKASQEVQAVAENPKPFSETATAISETPASDLFGVPGGAKQLTEDAGAAATVVPPRRRKSALPAVAAILVIAACSVGAVMWPRGKRPSPSATESSPSVKTIVPDPATRPQTDGSTQPVAATTSPAGPESAKNSDPANGSAQAANKDGPPHASSGLASTAGSDNNTGSANVKPISHTSGTELPSTAAEHKIKNPATGGEHMTGTPARSTDHKNGSAASKSVHKTGSPGAAPAKEIARNGSAGKMRAASTAAHGVATRTNAKPVPAHAKIAVKTTVPVKRHTDTEIEARRARLRRQAEREAEARRNRARHAVKPAAKVEKPAQHKALPPAPDQGDNGRK